jgi:hypothetical protein
MSLNSKNILFILDKCCESFTFPMLDNGYVYPAATRLTLYRSQQDWAIVIEVFGFSPRAGIPDTQIYTFASRLQRKRKAKDFVTQQAYENYMAKNEFNELEFIFPIEEGDWLDPDTPEQLANGTHTVLVRGSPVPLPPLSAYAANGITLQEPPHINVFEFCRYLAATARNDVLATADERRICVPPELTQIMQLEEWRQPDLFNNERPSTSATFRSLAEVLVSGDVSMYQATERPNTHWSNWPEGGTL